MRAGAEPVSIIIVPRSVGGQELPEPVAGTFLRSNAVVNLASGRWSTRGPRAPRWQAGARFSNLRNFQEGVLESPGVTTDFEVVRRNALAVDALLEKAQEVRDHHAQRHPSDDAARRPEGEGSDRLRDGAGDLLGPARWGVDRGAAGGDDAGGHREPLHHGEDRPVDEPFRMEIKDGWIVKVEGGKQAQALNELFESRIPTPSGSPPSSRWG